MGAFDGTETISEILSLAFAFSVAKFVSVRKSRAMPDPDPTKMEKSASIAATNGSVQIGWATADGIKIQITEAQSRDGTLEFTADQGCELATVLLSACRTAGLKERDLIPDKADDMLALTERLRTAQEQVTATDMRVAAGYIELLLKYVSDEQSARSTPALRM